MTKKNLARLIIVLFPFIAVWTLCICTMFTFSPIEIFSSGLWAGLTVIYYMFFVWLGLAATEEME